MTPEITTKEQFACFEGEVQTDWGQATIAGIRAVFDRLTDLVKEVFSVALTETGFTFQIMAVDDLLRVLGRVGDELMSLGLRCNLRKLDSRIVATK